MNYTRTNFIWGVPENIQEISSLPIVNLPVNAEKVRLRFRIKREAFAFVSTGSSITKYVLGQVEGGLKLLWPVAQNAKQ